MALPTPSRTLVADAVHAFCRIMKLGHHFVSGFQMPVESTLLVGKIRYKTCFGKTEVSSAWDPESCTPRSSPRSLLPAGSFLLGVASRIPASMNQRACIKCDAANGLTRSNLQLAWSRRGRPPPPSWSARARPSCPAGTRRPATHCSLTPKPMRRAASLSANTPP